MVKGASKPEKNNFRGSTCCCPSPQSKHVESSPILPRARMKSVIFTTTQSSLDALKTEAGVKACSLPRNKKLFWARKVFFASTRPKGEKAKPQQSKPGAQHVVFQARAAKKVRCQKTTFGARKVVFQTRAFFVQASQGALKRFAQATQRSNSSCLSLKKLFTERICFLVARKTSTKQSERKTDLTNRAYAKLTTSDSCMRLTQDLPIAYEFRKNAYDCKSNFQFHLN